MLIELIWNPASISCFCLNHPGASEFRLVCPFLHIRRFRTFTSTFYNTFEDGCHDDHFPSKPIFSSGYCLYPADTGENYSSGSLADADPWPCLWAGANEMRIIATISWQLDVFFLVYLMWKVDRRWWNRSARFIRIKTYKGFTSCLK